MKVGTDGVLLGAWVTPENSRQILDVGTGSGLIAIMMAQKTDAEIDAIEIDKAASEQAAENIIKSPWSDRLKVYNISLQDYGARSEKKYDLIVSNPPFFNSGPQADQKERATARHNNELTITELIYHSRNLLRGNGKVALILPVDMRQELVSCIAQNGLWIEKETRVVPIPGKPVNRILFLLSVVQNQERVVNEIVLEENGRHQYSKDFQEITKEYYTFF